MSRYLATVLPGGDHFVENGSRRFSVFDDLGGITNGFCLVRFHTGLCRGNDIGFKTLSNLFDLCSLNI